MAEDVAASKWLSFVLRHDPGAAGLDMDAGGWVDVDSLLAASPAIADRAALEAIVRQSGKQRFALSEDGRRIRANQGHSVQVDLGLTPLTPPETLWHGTATRFLVAIRAEGLTRQQRHHVHLSADPETARQVGARHGQPAVLRIAAGRMAGAGHVFFRSDNGVWLTEVVPPRYLDPIAT